MAKWDEGYYITALAGSDNMSSLLVMSKGSKFTQQSYKVGARGGGPGECCRAQHYLMKKGLKLFENIHSSASCTFGGWEGCLSG